MLQRHVTHQIISDLEYFPVVGIVGPRQVGKTTLAKMVVKQTKAQHESIYLDLELDADRRKLSDAETYLKYHQDKCVVIDEVQRMPELFPLLRALVDMERRPGRFILLGSASPEMIKGSSETLAGRIAYTELTPFSWPEAAGTVTMNHHWMYGGFPQAMLAGKPAFAKRWLESFTKTFIERDLQELGHLISPQLVARMLEMVASLNGQLLNQSELATSLGVSQPTVSRYLDLLEGGFIIQRLQPYYVNTKKRLVKQPKIYIRDSGILHHLLSIGSMEKLLGNAAIGASWESYVVEQIRRISDGKAKIYFYKTHKGAESDLIIVTAQGRYCVEIKRAATIARGFYEVIKDVEPESSYVIVPEGESYPTKDNITVVNLDTFLKETLPMMIAGVN
jgi:predicted AAA+ superfamily ATPase